MCPVTLKSVSALFVGRLKGQKCCVKSMVGNDHEDDDNNTEMK
jgi:hypothetical protein